MDIQLGTLTCPFTAWRPADGRVFTFYSFDTETTDIDDERPYLTPAYVLGAACDGKRGVYITRDHLSAFIEAHRGVPMVCHNAAFDLKVINTMLRPKLDIYQAVDANLVWDTLVLKRLYSLATAGHTARGEAGLADCTQAHLGIALNKGKQDAQGHTVRTSFGKFLGKPPEAIPAEYLVYLGQDALATWHLFVELLRLIKDLLQGSQRIYGFVSPNWLGYVVSRFGPLTHHIQLRASILMDALRCNGIGIDQTRQEEKANKVKEMLAEAKEHLRQHGYLAGEKGSDKALQSILTSLKRNNPNLELQTTPTGKWSTAEEDLMELAAEDSFFADFRTYKVAEKLLSTYLRKMGRSRLHPQFGYLLQTGRTYCSGGFNLQNLPREKNEKEAAATIRGCFVPGENQVFIDCDYSQIELVVLGYVCQHQLGLPSRLAQLINDGQDVHRLIAAAVLSKDPKDVSKEERNSAKPVSFGRPGGMAVRGLKRVAKNGYGVELTDEQVQQRIDAYHMLCPELDQFLLDEVDSGQVIAHQLHLTPATFCQAIGRYYDPILCQNNLPAGYLGGMLLKVLRDRTPKTQKGQAYTQAEIEFFWQRAQDLPIKLPPKLEAKLRAHQADRELGETVRSWAGRRPVFTVTGRLRANATFCSSRNCLFQGAAADGALLGLWRVWRAGYKVVDFVHDQLVVESPADAEVKDRLTHIESLMKAGMLEVVPGMKVQVESVLTRSLNKNDLDSRYDPKTMALLTPTPALGSEGKEKMTAPQLIEPLPEASTQALQAWLAALSTLSVEEVIRSLELRDYQGDAVRTALNFIADRARGHILDIPTGAGKTRVGIALTDILLQRDYVVLWVTKNWQLLGQAAADIKKLLPHRTPLLSRIGGADDCLRDLPDTPGQVFFTTLQTWRARHSKLPAAVTHANPWLAVIWDEAHWAINSRLGIQFLEEHRYRAVVYGLTATPPENLNVHLVYRKPVEELWGTVLPPPRILEVDTAIPWQPQVNREDFTPSSLHALGNNHLRNVVILNELLRGRGAGDYRRSIIFACDISHATTLGELLGQHGVAARVVHSAMSSKEQERAIAAFQDGSVSVLINVAMLVEGFDVPAVDSVFLTRPTRSRQLLTQMMGRGARKAPGKDYFNVVQFADQLAERSERPLAARDVYQRPEHAGGRQRSRPRLLRHQESPDAPRFEDVTFAGVGTLTIAKGQTFGVEIELTAPGGIPAFRSAKWRSTAKLLIEGIQAVATAPVWAHPLGYHDPSAPDDHWRVTNDSSAGWEVISPILLEGEGFAELQAVCDGLTALVARQPNLLQISHRTGLHITLAARLQTDEQLRGLIRRVQRLEPGLYTLTSPSRLYEFDGCNYNLDHSNWYCKPLRTLPNAETLRIDQFVQQRDNRYHSVNLTRSREEIQKLEVRLHGGSTEFRKIAPWIALWMQVFNRSRYAWTGTSHSGPVLPGHNISLDPEQTKREDILALLREEGIVLTPEFARMLKARRQQLRESWRRALPLRVASWVTAGWYDPPLTPTALTCAGYYPVR